MVVLGTTSTGCCTANLASSVELTIVDAVGACPQTVTVFVRHDDEWSSEFDCEMTVREGGCTCGELIGGEEAGDFTLTVTSADGLRHGFAEVDVGSGLCHVDTEAVVIDLQ